MPQIRPFRALRFDSSAAGDLAAVIAPPYQTIDATEHERLLARHPANIVRVDLPEVHSGDEPDDGVRRAARALAAWRSGAILHKDPHPSLYLYERNERSPDGSDRRQLGYFARLRLEPFGPDAALEATEDPTATDERYRLMRATGINSSPVIGVYDDPTHAVRTALAATTARSPEIDVTDDAGVRHRVWAVAADGDAAAEVASLIGPATAGPITIIAGRATYDSALRYRDERRMSRSCEEDPAFDYVLALLIERSDLTDDPSAATGLVLNPHEW